MQFWDSANIKPEESDFSSRGAIFNKPRKFQIIFIYQIFYYQQRTRQTSRIHKNILALINIVAYDLIIAYLFFFVFVYFRKNNGYYI